ncbi:MAG: DUF4249 domain-containing protein [Bacteroidota bacterium]
MLASCTEIIDIELNSTYRRLVVYGEVSSDSLHHQVSLSYSSDYFYNKPSPGVSDARVELEFDNELIVMEEYDSLPGVYLSPIAFRGTVGEKYSLSVSQVDVDDNGEEENYHAVSIMPGGLVLDSISLLYFSSPFGSGYQVLMYAFDPPEREWYNFKLWRNRDMLTDTLIKYSVQTDDFFNNSYISGLPVGFLSDDDPREAVQPGDTITFELNSIPQDYYNFIVDAQLEIMGNNPLFSGPPANIRSNIQEGGMGIFTAYSIQRVSSIAPPNP